MKYYADSVKHQKLWSLKAFSHSSDAHSRTIRCVTLCKISFNVECRCCNGLEYSIGCLLMEDRSRLQFSGQIVPSCSKMCLYNKDDESVVFKVNLVGAMRNQVRVTNLLTVFKADLVILDDGSILEPDEVGFSIDTFNAGASYEVTIVAQKSKSFAVLHSSTSHTKQIPKEIDKCMTQLIEGENGKDGEKVEEIFEYEKLRNERVAFNQKRLFELVPGKRT